VLHIVGADDYPVSFERFVALLELLVQLVED
jgi:hypothetical protein